MTSPLLALLPMCLAVAVAGISAPLGQASAPETPCAFEFVINSSGGAPVESVGVVLRSRSGREQVAKTDSNGVVRFCDAHLEFHELTIGGPTCGQLRVGYLEPGLPDTVKMAFTYRECHGFRAQGLCSYVLRFEASDGGPVQGMAVLFANGNRVTSSKRSDEFGRVFGFLPYDSTITVRPGRSGSSFSAFTLSCTPGGGEKFEKRIPVP